MSESIKKMRAPRIKKSKPVIIHEQEGGEEKSVDEPVAAVEPTVKTIKVRKPRKKKNEVMALVDSSDDSVEDAKPVPEKDEASPKKKPSNNWIDHVKSFREAHPEVSYKDALKQAKETYKK